MCRSACSRAGKPDDEAIIYTGTMLGLQQIGQISGLIPGVPPTTAAIVNNKELTQFPMLPGSEYIRVPFATG